MITADIHMHSSFSGDSNEPAENMIESAIKKGFKTICFTEHMDMDFPPNDEDKENIFLLDTDSYYSKFCDLKEKYTIKNPDFNILFGVELGLQPHLASTHKDYIKDYPFDFIIGSEHTTNRKDPYYPSFFEGKSEYEAYTEYFTDIVTNIDAFSDFNSLGHLDYVVRYGPNKNNDYSYSKYSDVLDTILKRLIDNGIALEINTGGYKYGLGNPNPSGDILKRYKELGGELITVGSDAHDISRIGADFNLANDLLTNIGFKYYCVYKNRKPIILPID